MARNLPKEKVPGERVLQGPGGVPTPPAPGAIQWRTERRKVSSLSDWPKNPRILTEAQAKHLGASLKTFGYVEPIAINLDGQIIGGHMRRRVLQLEGLINPDSELDVRVPSRQLTDEEVEELSIRLNRNTGEWDFDRLSNEFEEEKLLEWGFDPWDFGKAGEEEGHGEGGGPASEGIEHTCPKCGHKWTDKD